MEGRGSGLSLERDAIGDSNSGTLVAEDEWLLTLNISTLKRHWQRKPKSRGSGLRVSCLLLRRLLVTSYAVIQCMG